MTTPSTAWRHIAAVCLDLLAASCAVAALMAVATAGFEFQIAGIPVSLHTPHNPLAGWIGLTCLRYSLPLSTPLLGIPALRPARLDEHLRVWWNAVRSWLDRLDASRAGKLVLLAAAVTLGIKLINAVSHEGFFGGDDVEIHEMTLGALLGRDWPVSALRSAFFPFVFIYPWQAAAAALGVTDVGILVAIGRSAVAAWSTAAVWLLWQVVRSSRGIPIALLSAVLLAGSHLLVDFGSTELPRPVSAIFVLGAFGALSQVGPRFAVLAGLLLAAGAAMRFSEVVFIVPAVVQLLLERRVRHLLVFTLTWTVAVAVIQMASDALYWGEPLFSVRQIVQFTLIEGASTRGYESAWRYLETINAWTDPIVFGLALWATGRRSWREALWLWLPIALLSTLPHKESRYLILCCRISACWRPVASGTSSRERRRPLDPAAGSVCSGWRSR